MKRIDNKTMRHNLRLLLAGISIVMISYGCNDSSASIDAAPQQQAMPLPVMTVGKLPATTYQDYTASLEGKVNVEIRPQVEGYLEKIFVDEGAYVNAGQVLFKINDRPYQEQLSNAKASVQAAQANLRKAQVELDRLEPLVKNNVISEVQLTTARSAYDAAQAAVSQAQSGVGNAQINLGYTRISAPVSGYIGRIPYKTGSLVGRGEAMALTVLSDVREVYAYFAMSEVDFLKFSRQSAGATLEQKVKQMPPVELVLADNSIYPGKGMISSIEGQFDKTTGAISFRATFPNPSGILRTGNTGKVRIPQQFTDAVVVPIESTFEVQDKVFVFTVGDSNKVASKPINVSGKTTNYYFVKDGLIPGEKIVFTGTGNLQDGMAIIPNPISADSLLKVKPL